MSIGEFEVIPCPPKLRPIAIRRLHDALPAMQQAAFVAALDAVGVKDEAAWRGLFIAKPQATDGEAKAESDLDRVDVAWLQPLPGKTACVWLADPLGGSGAVLLRRVGELGAQTDLALVQYIVDDDRADLANVLVRCDFVRLVELDYLFVELDADSGATVVELPENVQFVCNALKYPERLARILDATYAGTHDCPALDGVRRIEDVIEGYRAVGRFVADHWYLVEHDGHDAGALILADHSDTGNWEVVYMGVTPEFRGHGLGRQIVRQARRVATVAGAQRLVLAVDAANSPALSVYRDAGFRQWCRRIVYAWLRNPPPEV